METKTQTPEEVRVELENTDKDQLIEYIFNQATIIGKLNLQSIAYKEELEEANANKQTYVEIAIGLQSKLDAIEEVLGHKEGNPFDSFPNWVAYKESLKEETNE